MPAYPLDRLPLRQAYRMEEAACVAERLKQAAPASAVHAEASKLAIKLVEGARRRKASGLDAFLQQFGLDTEEGIALMCLAEALLRVPERAPPTRVIPPSRITGQHWAQAARPSPPRPSR